MKTLPQLVQSIAFLECDIGTQTIADEIARLSHLQTLRADFESRADSFDRDALDRAIARQRRAVAQAQRDGEYD